MERKDYAERIMNVKNDILVEIRKILGYNAKHDFSEPFFIHYVEREVATTDECVRIEIDNDGKVIVVYRMQGDFETFTTEGDAVFNYSCESFIDFIDNLKKEVREKKLTVLRDLIIMNGGKISFNGSFTFSGCSEGDNVADCKYTKLLGLEYQQNDGRMIILDEWQGHVYNNSAKYIPDSELDRIIEYVRNQTENNVALTEKQEDAVQGFIAAYNTLKKLNVCIIRDNADDKLHFLNGEKVEEFIPAVIGSVKADYAIVDVTDQMLKNTSCEQIITDAYNSIDGEHVYAKPLKS